VAAPATRQATTTRHRQHEATATRHWQQATAAGHIDLSVAVAYHISFLCAPLGDVNEL